MLVGGKVAGGRASRARLAGGWTPRLVGPKERLDLLALQLLHRRSAGRGCLDRLRPPHGDGRYFRPKKQKRLLVVSEGKGRGRLAMVGRVDTMMSIVVPPLPR